MEKINVLIYPGNNPIAINVYESLKDMVLFKPYLATSKEDFDKILVNNYIEGVPFIYDNNFIDVINEKILEYGIKYILPMHDTVAYFLKQIEGKLKAKVVCSNLKTCEICRYKSKTYEALKGEPYVPNYCLNYNMINEFPIFMKDDIGQGGKNSYIIKSKEELKRVLAENIGVQYVFCELLEGQELTVDCFTDNKGKLVIVSPRIRLKTIDGKCSLGKTVKLSNEIKYIANNINEHIEFRGGWYFQCKQDKDGKFKLLEVSTRLAGTHGISKHLDINFAALSLYDWMGYDNLQILPNNCVVYQAKAYRDEYKIDYKYDAVYFDFDDTIVVNKEKYIPQTLAFLFQLKNQGKEVYLITRHDVDIYKTLKKVHIDKDLFDGIMQIDAETEKYEVIDTSKKCIFIDNSFNERIKVKRALNIPTFDVSNIEALYDRFN